MLTIFQDVKLCQQVLGDCDFRCTLILVVRLAEPQQPLVKDNFRCVLHDCGGANLVIRHQPAASGPAVKDEAGQDVVF